MTRPESSQAPDLSSVATEIESWLRDHLRRSGADAFVLGLSGGIDSALVCGLASRAVGADKVIGVVMPSSSNAMDAELAQEVAAAFGVRTMIVDLTTPTATLKSSLPSAKEVAATLDQVTAPTPESIQLGDANLKPRLRMTVVYYVANLCRGLVLGTGNKSEAMIGYFTKYGDGGVDLLPIVDLYKHEVRAMAREIGVPGAVVKRAPSAGLWEGQTDESELGISYDQLDEALIAITTGNTEGIDTNVLGKVQRMIAASEHKRAPVPAFRRA